MTDKVYIAIDRETADKVNKCDGKKDDRFHKNQDNSRTKRHPRSADIDNLQFFNNKDNPIEQKVDDDNKTEMHSFLTESPPSDTPIQCKSRFLRWKMFYQGVNLLRRQIFISCCLNINFISDGYGIGWSAPILVKLKNPAETPLPTTISETTGSWLASIIFLGLFVLFTFVINFLSIVPALSTFRTVLKVVPVASSCTCLLEFSRRICCLYLAGYFSNVIGRKPCLIIGSILMFAAYLILSFSTSIRMMYFGRFMAGFSQSFYFVTGLIYIGEMSSPRIRGTFLTLTAVSHNLGALIVYCVGPYTSYRGVNYIAVGFIILGMIACCFVPETPVYYLLKGKDEAAKSSLHYLGRSNDIDIEMEKIKTKLQLRESRSFLWRQLLFNKSNRKALLVTVTMYFLQMNGGIIFFMFFATSIFEKAGSNIEPHVATIITGLTSFLGSLLAPVSVDKFGRRLLLIISTGGCSICMTAMGAYFYVDKYHHSIVSELGWLPLLTMVTVFIVYGLGLNSIPHTLNSEMYSPKVRGLGSSISLISAWISGFISTTVASYLMIYLGTHFTFWLFGVVNAITLIFVLLAIPETTGKTLTEIDDMMAG